MSHWGQERQYIFSKWNIDQKLFFKIFPNLHTLLFWVPVALLLQSAGRSHPVHTPPADTPAAQQDAARWHVRTILPSSFRTMCHNHAILISLLLSTVIIALGSSSLKITSAHNHLKSLWQKNRSLAYGLDFGPVVSAWSQEEWKESKPVVVDFPPSFKGLGHHFPSCSEEWKDGESIPHLLWSSTIMSLSFCWHI